MGYREKILREGVDGKTKQSCVGSKVRMQNHLENKYVLFPPLHQCVGIVHVAPSPEFCERKTHRKITQVGFEPMKFALLELAGG